MTMKIVSAALILTAVLLTSRGQTPSGYVGSESCASCHRDIAASYEKVSMSHSLGRIGSAKPIEDWEVNNKLYHKPSGQYFMMTRRNGRFFQRRYQLDANDRETNSLEVEIHFTIGSGNHERDYIYRSPAGELFQLPVAWYAENNAWGMAPGYDRPDHEGFSRRVNYRCVFCHSAYPSVPAGSDRSESELSVFPENTASSIDCERCHGPGERHVNSPRATNIVNPRNLGRKLEIDVCMQCHLETTSASLPNSVLKLGRGVFSFRPGEALEDYAAYFDYPAGSGRDEFNIVHQAYRLRKSQCFINSSMTCTTCHNPHQIPERPKAFFNGKCNSCHDAQHGEDCIACHMPKRRTDDVVHVVMTDHYIQRRPSQDLLRPKSEGVRPPYRGDLAFYIPEPKKDLYLGLALSRGADLKRGVQLLERENNSSAEVYFQLAAAYSGLGDKDKAMAAYRRVVELNPNHAEAWFNIGVGLMNSGKTGEAAAALQKTIQGRPQFADAHVAFGVMELRLGRLESGRSHLLEAMRLDPFNVPALNNLGMLEMEQGHQNLAVQYFEQVLRIKPDDPTAGKALGK